MQGQMPAEAIEQRDGGVTLMDMLRIIRKHLISAIITFVVVFAAVCAYTLLVPPKYSATTQLFATYSQTSANSDDISSVNNASSYIANQIKSYPTLTTTEAVLQPVIDDLGLNVTVEQLGQQLTVSNPTNTAFVNITVEDSSPQQSATIANNVAKSLKSVVENSLYASDQKSPVTLSIVQQATEPTSPSSPKVALNMAIGLVVGAILAVFVALIRDLLSTKVQEAHDLQEIIDAPIMGRIPDDEALKQPVPVIVSAPSSSIAEEYRRVRTNLSFTAPVEGTNARLIVISSVSPNEGKTTTSANIAATLAENGASVLLIDADLRHPSVADKLSLEGNAGLAHVLSGQASVKDVVQRYWKPNLHIMPAGPKPPNASALLNSATMKELIRQALTQYDYVIIDTSPMIVANDAAVFGAMGSGIVLVSGRDVTDKRELRDIASQLDNLGVSVTGFVFNFAKEGKKTSSYGNYYYDDDDATQQHRKKRRSSAKK
ncbi:polysaccharide biosynthesis tyrosine autokinase [Bifidobacterium sp. 82T10]|uniref:non-specific protein-tyrosine kinase n=1 Tax=Bifidobacterium miconis TaxID=2834435 RepID=A0ABS6WD64_9BIFI|nr:polysaccharide biosynthesis tyrosine autokinase [Bifidobacterium miconis]MBW3091645.1 polysaccharide biosynthesis tyrosine autokinase [Bifidobacterium miconis]